MDNLKIILFELFSLSLGLEPNFIYKHCDNADISVKINWYPITTPKEGQARFPVHTDITPLTILATDDTINALKVQLRNSNWVFADPIPNAFFINIGDLMARWTNHHWVATPHQVVWPEQNWTNRMSIAFFAVTNYDAKISCITKNGEKPIYPPQTFKEIISDKLHALDKGDPDIK